MDTKNTSPAPGKARIGIFILLAVYLFAMLPVTGVFPCGRRGVKGASLEGFTAHMDQRVKTLMKRYRIPGASVALVEGGQIVWTKAYGYAELETGRPLTPDTPMRVQSIAKSVTAWGVMKLVEQGKIELDSPAARYMKNWTFPKSEFAAQDVTVRQLLNHTSGLPLGDVFTIYAPTQEVPSLQESLGRQAVLMREPGTAFYYSNTGYNLLELLVQEVTGQDFAEYMRQEVLLPLGMEHSNFDWSEALDPPVPTGYDLGGDAVPVYVFAEKGSGGLFASAEDIARFIAAGMTDFSDNPVLGPESIDQLHTPSSRKIGVYNLVFDAYGLGHYIEALPNGRRAVSHGGQGTGIMTHFHAVPETGDGIVILTNSQRSWPFIAYLLSDWAQWRGFPTVGMGRIIWGKYGLWAFVGVIWSAALLLVLQLITRGMRRKEAPSPKRRRLWRLVQLVAGTVILAILAWCVSQKYLFITSVFPIASVALGICMFALAVVLLLSALLPAKRRENHAAGEDR
ncbi:MAG: serine hydrolase domain-containing protein [Christensenellales bacterium]|jgi:CubicO group peptidase (beta-lactamase class C family)